MPVFIEFIQAILKRKWVVLGSVIACVMVAMLAFRAAPRKYKVQTIISIQTQYFQNPLVRDFLPETFDGAELRSQRETLIRRSLNHEFLEKIGRKYGLLKVAKSEAVSTFELDLLLRRFEIVGAGPTTYLIGFFASDPEIAYKVVNDATAKVRETLMQERRATLLRLRAAVQERIEALAFGHQSGRGSVAASRPDLLKSEIERTETELRSLTSQYSEAHPKVAQTRRKLEQLKSWLQKSPQAGKATKDSGEFAGSPEMSMALNLPNIKINDASKGLYEDLLKKYHYLEVVITLDEQNQEAYMSVVQQPFVPLAPLWPKRPIFLVWGVAGGFMIGAFLVLFLEMARSDSLRLRLLELIKTGRLMPDSPGNAL